jgi:hypothetical protein
MPIQDLLVVALAVAAAAYLSWTTYRAWKGGCSTGCGSGACASPAEAKPKLIPADDLLERARQRRSGERGGG